MNTPNKNARIDIRLDGERKKRLEDEAKTKGISLTELILARAEGSKVPDRALSKGLFTAIETIVREMNYIGNNINQVTIALHLIKQRRKLPADELKRLAQLLVAYFEKLDAVRDLLHKTRYNDI